MTSRVWAETLLMERSRIHNSALPRQLWQYVARVSRAVALNALPGGAMDKVGKGISWNWRHSVVLLVLLVALLEICLRLLGWPFVTGDGGSAVTTWFVVMLLTTAILMVVGWGITGRPYGVLIDERNKLSLSRLQITVWTIVVLSAWITAVVWNLAAGKGISALDISLPQTLWLLLGISTTSLVASPLILSTKTTAQINPLQLQRQLRLAASKRGITAKPKHAGNAQTQQPGSSDPGIDTPDLRFTPEKGVPIAMFTPDPVLIQELKAALKVDAQGAVVVNTQLNDASLADLFAGDEVGNFVQVDLSKAQMLLITIVIVVAYATALGAMFIAATSAGITQFPDVDSSMVALLAISHSGYLAYKAVPHTALATDQSASN